MKRYLILNGDKTTANGVVQAVPTTIQLSDKDIAHKGIRSRAPLAIQRENPVRRITPVYDRAGQ
jgi:hypothetical protein